MAKKHRNQGASADKMNAHLARLMREHGIDTLPFGDILGSHKHKPAVITNEAPRIGHISRSLDRLANTIKRDKKIAAQMISNQQETRQCVG